MKNGKNLLLATVVFLSCVSRANIDRGREKKEEQQTFFERMLEAENKNIGAKIGYGLKAADCYRGYLLDAVLGQQAENERQLLDFRKYYSKYQELPSSYTERVSYCGFGYWLYKRMAFPVGKKNWGRCNRTVAGLAIAAWLLKDTPSYLAKSEDVKNILLKDDENNAPVMQESIVLEEIRLQDSDNG